MDHNTSSNTNNDHSQSNPNDLRSADLDHIGLDPSNLDDLKTMVETGAVRDVSGLGNNLNNPVFGTANQPLIRITTNETGPNGEPRGVINGVQTLPNERDISNIISNQDDNKDGVEDQTVSPHGTNLFLMSFGQFFDHGLDFLKRSSNPSDTYTIPLRQGDSLYRFSDDGNPANDITSITLRRGEEAIDPNTGEPFQYLTHINMTSPPIDKNQAYGSSNAITYYLRESKRDANGNVVTDSNGMIVKLASMAVGAPDQTGRDNLPTYLDILLNNGMSRADIDAAVAANSFAMLQQAKGFVDYRNVIDPVTGQPDGNPLLLDAAPNATPGRPGFSLASLLEHYIGGDGRVNENVMLTPIHLVFFRDHEFWLDTIREQTNNSWTEDEYFEAAKSIVESEYQRIIFDEFIDAMAGSLPGPTPHGFDGYHPRVDSQVSEEFAHAMYRVGHSMINEMVPFIGADGTLKEMSLVQAFLSPGTFEDIGGKDLIVGQTLVSHQRIDENLVNAVRNQLLGQASDLAAINIARGREVGVPSLNDVRKFLYENGSAQGDNGSDVTRALVGNPELKPYSSWEDFAKNLRDPSLVELFKQVYKSVDDVDLWIGGLAEKRRSQEEGQMGTTFTWIFWEQMDRLQDGDRFYYKGRFADTEILGALETQTFADIIMRTTGAEFLNDQVFFLSNQVRMGLTEKARTFTDANETIVGNDLDNEIWAGGGNDTVYGGKGNDKIWGGDGDDGLRGEAGDDMIWGGDGDDRIVGGDGNDQLWGGKGQDAINGNAGNDIIYGEDGDDELHGNEGDDIIYGGKGDDVIKGGIGNDMLYGDAGNDYIESNGGNDHIWTGSGRDVVLMSDDAGYVTIHDFDKNYDRIDMKLFGIRNWADLQAKLDLKDVSGGTVLKIGTSEIFVKGMKMSDFTMDNFKFRNDDQNLVINGRMDEGRIVMKDGEPVLVFPVEKPGQSVYLTNEQSTGWKNAADNRVEYQMHRGNTVLELDVDKKVDEIYQLLPTVRGELYSISFDAKMRDNPQTSTVEILWNGDIIGKFDPGADWNSLNFEAVGTGGKDKLSFREEAKDNNKKGAFLDNVIVAPKDAQPQRYTLTGNGDANIYTDLTMFPEFIDGGGGEDVFKILAEDTGYSIAKNADGYNVITVKDQIVAGLKNVEKIVFTNATYMLDEAGNFVKDGPIDPVDPDTVNVIEAGDAGGYLVGTDGDDDFRGGPGKDTFFGGKGNDIYDGAGGDYNQVDFAGAAADYRFTRNADGSVTVIHPIEGTDTLRNIDGLWFYGEAKWYSLDSLVGKSPTDPNGVNVIEAGDAGGYFVGTAGNDEFRGGAGKDTFFGGKGDDIYDGAGGDYNQVDYAGSASDYSFSRNADGTVTVAHTTEGTDVLKNIDGLWFYGEAKWYSLDSLVGKSPTDPNGVNVIEAGDAGGYFVGTDGDDDFRGGAGNDTFVGGKGDDIYDGAGGAYNQVDLQGRFADYTFVKNDDGTLVASHAEYGEDILKNIDGIWVGEDSLWMSTNDLGTAA